MQEGEHVSELHILHDQESGQFQTHIIVYYNFLEIGSTFTQTSLF